MREKEHCGECEFLKYVDADGIGYCSLLEEYDVCATDEACINYHPDNGKEVNDE